MGITERKLERIYGLRLQIIELDAQIKTIYNTYRSPSFSKTGSRNGEISDPVTRAFNRLQVLDEQKEKCLAAWIDFEKELSQIPEIDIQAIIRWRYLLPKKNGCSRTWREINKRVYGYPDHYFARNRLQRFLENQTDGENS